MSAVREITFERVHIRFDGRSVDSTVTEMGITPGMTDLEIKRRMADYLDVSIDSLSAGRIERDEKTGSLWLQPEAQYG